MSDASVYRPEFLNALRILADACEEVYQRATAVLSSAAVEFYTGGAVLSGDIDVVGPEAQVALEDALISRGFERPKGPGMLLVGVIHKELHIGAQVVSGYLFEGNSEVSRVRLVSLDDESVASVAFPPVEDMIADRMSQFCATNQPDKEMLEQARVLYEIASSALETSLDEVCLDKRIRQETLGRMA